MNQNENIELLREKNLDKYRIVVCADEGMSKYEIGQRLQMDKKTVQGILDKFEQHGSVEIDLRKGHSGRPRKINEEENMELRNQIIVQNLN